MTAAESIDRCTARLAVAFQRKVDAGTMKIYREALEELPVWAIEAAEKALRKTGGDFFPTSAKWHQEAAKLVREDRQRQDRILALQAHTSETYHCRDCRDFGLRAVIDAKGEERMAPCPCRSSNPQYQQKDAQRRLSGEALGPSPTEAKELVKHVPDWKQIGSGE